MLDFGGKERKGEKEGGREEEKEGMKEGEREGGQKGDGKILLGGMTTLSTE